MREKKALAVPVFKDYGEALNVVFYLIGRNLIGDIVISYFYRILKYCYGSAHQSVEDVSFLTSSTK